MGSEARFAEVAANTQEAFSVRCGVGSGTEESRDSPLATQRGYGSPRAARAVLGGSHQEAPGGTPGGGNSGDNIRYVNADISKEGSGELTYEILDGEYVFTRINSGPEYMY